MIRFKLSAQNPNYWSGRDLLAIADRIRYGLVGGRGATIEDYVSAAKSKSSREIGYFDTEND